MSTLADWILTSWSSVLLIVLSTVCAYAVIIFLTRVNGLRSFSKMSGFDFAMTVAVGSLFAGTIISDDPPLLRGAVALASIFAGQRLVASLRVQGKSARQLIDNEPLLLMKGQTIYRENLKKARVTEDDLYGKLREANVLNLSQVRAVVFESTGDVSVLHGDENGPELSDEIMSGVQESY